jgi:hypothetical protein
MATQLSEEVVTFFRGNSTGLAQTINQVNSLVQGQARREKIVSDEIRRIRERQERDTLLAPVRQQLAAQRAADARVRLEGEAAAKIERIRKASSASNIAKELHSNFGANAKLKIGGVLQNSLGLSEDAAEGLVGKVGKIAPYLVAAGAAGTLLAKTFQAGNRLAGEQAEKLNSMAEEMRRTSRVNIFTASADGVEVITERLSGVREQLKGAKLAQQENDPFGFGGGVIGNMRTVLGKTLQASQSAVGLGPNTNFEQQKNAKNLLELEQRGKDQERVKLQKELTLSVKDRLDLTRSELGGNKIQADLRRLELDWQKQISALRRDGIARPEDIKGLKEVNRLLSEQLMFEEKLRLNQGIHSFVGEQIAPGPNREALRAETALQAIQSELAAKQENAHKQGLSGIAPDEKAEYDARIQAAQNAVREARLAAVQHKDTLATTGAQIDRERILVRLGDQDLASKMKVADLDVRSAELTKEQAYSMEEYFRAEQQLQGALAERFELQKRAEHDERSSSSASFELARAQADIQGTNLAAAQKTYAVASKTRDMYAMELVLHKDISLARKRELELGISENDNAIRLMRQEQSYGKSALHIQQEIRRNKINQSLRDKFDLKTGKTDGLIDVRRGMNGNVIEGLDPLTGQWRAPAAGKGMAEQGLTGGSLSDAARPVGGGPRLIRDTDAGGGLHSGETPRIFERSSASEYLAGKKSVGETLAGHRGDPLHDPAARLAQAQIFRDFSKPTSELFHKPSESGAVAQLAKPGPGINDQSVGRTAVDAQRAMVTAQNITNQYLKTVCEILPQLAFTA